MLVIGLGQFFNEHNVNRSRYKLFDSIALEKAYKKLPELGRKTTNITYLPLSKCTPLFKKPFPEKRPKDIFEQYLLVIVKPCR